MIHPPYGAQDMPNVDPAVLAAENARLREELAEAREQRSADDMANQYEKKVIRWRDEP